MMKHRMLFPEIGKKTGLSTPIFPIQYSTRDPDLCNKATQERLQALPTSLFCLFPNALGSCFHQASPNSQQEWSLPNQMTRFTSNFDISKG